MLALLLRIVAFIAGLWLLRRLLGVFFASYRLRRNPAGREAGEPENVTAKKMVRDPTCGIYMDPRLAMRVELRGETLYFCSDDCRNRYESRREVGTAGSSR